MGERIDWAGWEPTYRAILADMGYDAAADEHARDALVKLMRGHAPVDMRALREHLAGKDVAIAGPRPSNLPAGPVIATDAATWAHAIADAIVTDLDGDIVSQQAANARGVPVFIHAHGDNVPALEAHVAGFRGPLAPTTQAFPVDGIDNFGGFTDGDRACCLAAHLGARSLVLVGFDFDRPWPKPGLDVDAKRRKLGWARRIIDALDIPWRLA